MSTRKLDAHTIYAIQCRRSIKPRLTNVAPYEEHSFKIYSERSVIAHHRITSIAKELMGALQCVNVPIDFYIELAKQKTMALSEEDHIRTVDFKTVLTLGTK